jgi:hypothetical protein
MVRRGFEMFEKIMDKIRKPLRIFTAAYMLLSFTPKVAVGVELPQDEDLGEKSSVQLTLDRRGDYTDKLEEILKAKNYEESMKNAIRKTFKDMDENYDEYAIEGKRKPKNEYIAEILDTINSKCDNAILVESQDEGGKEDKELQVLGAIGLAKSSEKEIIVKELQDPQQTSRVVLHELSHLKQSGFHVNYEIPYAYNLSRMLFEADATDNGNNVSAPRLQGGGYTDIRNKSDDTYLRINNTYNNYEVFVNLFKKLEYLTGKEFMEDWRKDKNLDKDYPQIMEQIIDGKYGKGTFEPIFNDLIKLAPFLKNEVFLSIDTDEAKKVLLNDSNYKKEKLGKIQDKQNFMEEAQRSIDLNKDVLAKNESILSDKGLLKESYDIRIQQFKDAEKTYQEEIEKYRDDTKRAEYLQKLKKELSQSNNDSYKEFIQGDIDRLNDPKKRANQIKCLEESLSNIRKDNQTYSMEKHEKELFTSNKVCKKEIEGWEKYKDTDYYDSKVKDWEKGIQLSNIAMEAVNENKPLETLMSLEKKVLTCMDKDIGNIKNRYEAINMTNKWHVYKKQFLLDNFLKSIDSEGNVKEEHYDVFNTKGRENKLIEKLDQYEVFPEFFQDKQLNMFAKEALLDCNVYDIRKASIKTAHDVDRDIFMISDDNGVVKSIYQLNELGKENIYNRIDNSSESYALNNLPKSVKAQLITSSKIPAMTRNSQEISKIYTQERGGESRAV